MVLEAERIEINQVKCIDWYLRVWVKTKVQI